MFNSAEIKPVSDLTRLVLKVVEVVILIVGYSHNTHAV